MYQTTTVPNNQCTNNQCTNNQCTNNQCTKQQIHTTNVPNNQCTKQLLYPTTNVPTVNVPTINVPTTNVPNNKYTQPMYQITIINIQCYQCTMQSKGTLVVWYIGYMVNCFDYIGYLVH